VCALYVGLSDHLTAMTVGSRKQIPHGLKLMFEVCLCVIYVGPIT